MGNSHFFFFNFINMKPQINADKRRFLVSAFIYVHSRLINPLQRTQSLAAFSLQTMGSDMNEINHKLVRTPYELTPPEFVSVSLVRCSVDINIKSERVSDGIS